MPCSFGLGGEFDCEQHGTSADDIPIQLQRRRPKNAPVVDTLLSRGHKNDGLIEIEDSEDEASEDEVVPEPPKKGPGKKGAKKVFAPALTHPEIC